MKKRTLKVFVDFDGTITLEDIGEAIFRKFGSAEKTNRIVDDLLTVIKFLHVSAGMNYVILLIKLMNKNLMIL